MRFSTVFSLLGCTTATTCLVKSADSCEAVGCQSVVGDSACVAASQEFDVSTYGSNNVVNDRQDDDFYPYGCSVGGENSNRGYGGGLFTNGNQNSTQTCGGGNSAWRETYIEPYVQDYLVYCFCSCPSECSTSTTTTSTTSTSSSTTTTSTTTTTRTTTSTSTTTTSSIASATTTPATTAEPATANGDDLWCYTGFQSSCQNLTVTESYCGSISGGAQCMYDQDSFTLFIVKCTTYDLSCVAFPTGTECDAAVSDDGGDTLNDNDECETCNSNGCQPEKAVQGLSGASHLALGASALAIAAGVSSLLM